jgi:hypothetical protein
VRNRYRRLFICIAFALASALSLQAQADHGNNLGQDDHQKKVGDPSQPQLTASLVEAPAGDVSKESDLPDAPSAARPDASTGEPTPSPVVKRESQGAPPAAVGGPLGVDRGVADGKYLAVTGAMFSASVANAELTLNCLTKHASCNDVPTSLHSRAALYGIGIPADLGIAYLTYHMKKKHSHIWYVPAAAVTGANLFFAYRAHHWAQERSIP